ncbi:MAG: hypothetical protein K6D02_09040, partial [Lachnospiraceae bacterium]|nr:hypothetical protein [Lachnospiraceae bacterium]
KVTTTFIFKAVSALVGLGGLVLVGLVALIIYIIDVIKANSDKDYTTVPDYLIDVATVSGGETSVKYEVKEGDLNGGKGNLGWVRLYSTTDSRIGSPLVVKNGVAPFAVSYGDPSFKNGREALTFFGEKSCGNLNTHMKNDDVGGIYINYTTEYSIKNLSENGENTGIYNKVENPNYLYDIIVSCADNEAEAKANITKKRGFYVWDKNLSPTVSSGKLKKFLDNKQYVYIGYQLTSDPTLAIRDLRVATFNNTQEMYFGSLKYTCAGTLGYNKMPDKNDETIPQDLDGLYYSADKKSGTPIRLENLHILTSHADAKEGWIPVTTFSGLPYNFNTTRVSLNKKIAVAGDYFLGPYRYTLNMDEYDKSFDCTYIYYEPEEVYTSGKKYLSGLFFIFGSDAVECLTSVGERAVAFADFITETKKIPNVTVFSDNNIASSFVYEGYSRESNQKYLHLCYTWSYNPYRALYDIDTYQGTLYNFELPYSIRKTLTYSKNKYGDPAETESYASASVYARRPLKPINEYAEDLIGIGVSPENAYMSSNGLIGRDEQVWEETYTKELQGGYDYGFTQMALLPTGLYVSGYVSDKEPLALEDVVISNNAYKAENIDGELVTKITNDKTLDGTEATGDFNSIQELKRPHRIEPFDLSYPEWTDDNDNTYKKGKHTYIYTREKRIKKKYISRIFVGEFSREESGYDDEDYLKEVDKVVDHQALLMATTQASDEVIPVNVAINQNEAWYRRKVDEDEELAAYEPDEDLKTPAAYLSVSRTDKTSEAVKGILLYKTDKDAVPEMIFVNHMEYYCGSTTIPIKRKNGSKYYLYYTYNTGANPGKPFTDITADSEVFQPEQSTALVINKPDNGDELSTPYGDITMETFIHGKYENGRNEYFNNFYLGSGDSRKEACLELLEQGCTEFIDMNMNKNAGGYKVYMGYKKYGLDEDAIKEKTTEAAKQAEIDRQMEEAVYDIMFTVGKPYQKNGFLSDKYQIYYLPVKDVDLNEGTDGPEIYMYFTTRYNAKLYNKRQGSDTRDNLSSMPDEYYKEPISRLSFTIGDKVPNIKDKFSQGLSNSLPWERVLCDDSKTVAELNEGAFGFDEDYNTEENRIYMFVQRADGYVKAPGEIVGGCTDEETYYGEMWFYK